MKRMFLSRMVNVLSRGRVKYGWWTADYRSETDPVVLGGCGRSGTTLMRAILNAHSRIAIGPETGLFCGNLDFQDLSRSLEMAPSRLQEIYRKSACLGEFIERTMSEVRQRSGKPRWGEKSPSNVLSIRWVFSFFPRARFLHMIRDGRDVVCSLRNHPKYRWVGGKRVPTNVVNPWPDCVSRWVRDTSAGLEWRSDPRYLEVKYEDLVTEPESTLRRVVSWLGEDWDPSVLSFHKTHVEHANDVVNPGVKLPIYQHAIGRWREELPPEAAGCFTDQAHALLVELGYTADATWASQLNRVAV